MTLLSLQRGFVGKLIIATSCVTFLLAILSFHPSAPSLSGYIPSRWSSSPPVLSSPGSCPPEVWADGQWTKRQSLRTDKQQATSVADVLEFEGFQGCAADREYRWHLSADDSELNRYPELTAYDWTPSSDTCKTRRFNPEEVVRDMVEQGGWLLIGDSVTEGHFFSLSCSLFPHVRATPNYTENPYFDRAWPQNLYLNPQSPLVQYLQLPEGFDIAQTPLVTFRRVDLLLTQDHLRQLYAQLHPERASQPGFELFGGDAVWEMAPAEYLGMLTAPLPEANYGTLIVSTAGHWTVGTMPGLKDTHMRGEGIDNVIEFFAESMKEWSDIAQSWLKSAEGVRDQDRQHGGGTRTKGGRKRKALVRAYLPGHDGCHNIQSPWTWYEQGRKNLPYNWGQIPTMNEKFDHAVTSGGHADVHYLAIDGPGLLRPDAHASGDCLHLSTGAGVIEGWSEYIWHYITREIKST
ncbi:hypothetical protein BDW22DRAFT_1363087 [Trametopsis cervina]|nr:hypothetical protein BDW22DRAFT_1363087 [Trametopsis cervina]